MANTEKSRNRGELSELYVLTRLLSDDHSTAFSGGNPSGSSTIHHVIVRHAGIDHQFLVFGPEVVVQPPGIDIFGSRNAPRVTRQHLKRLADQLLDEIRKTPEVAESRALPAVATILEILNLPDVCGSSTEKGDIGINYFDVSLGRHIERWFSIKSRIGAAPTFINAGANRVTYKLVGDFSCVLIDEWKKLDPQHMIAEIARAGGKFEYVDMQRQFRENLLVIDSCLDHIVADCLLESYLPGSRDVSDVVGRVAKRNRLGYPDSIAVTAHKLKFLNYLQDSSLGMVPSKPWFGSQTVTGGIIEVTKDGGLLIFQHENPTALREYFWTQTKFDTPSRKKFKNAIIRDDDGVFLLDLKVQIRYK